MAITQLQSSAQGTPGNMTGADIASSVNEVIVLAESLPTSAGVVSVVGGTNITVDATDPANPIVNADGVGAVASVVAGTNITVDATDPANPIVSSSGGGGTVDSVVAGTNITVDVTDPANPVVSTSDTALNKVDFGTFLQGAPTNSEKLITIVAGTAFTLPAGLTGTEVYAEVVSTAAATFTITKNDGGSLGTIDFALGVAVATFTFATPTAFAIGDRLQLVNQGTADATLADIAVTIRGNL